MVDRVATGRFSDRLSAEALEAFGGRTCRALVQDAPVRFVLDRETSHACAALARDCSELFDPDSPLLRFPAESFWLEWFEEPEEAGIPGERCQRLGIYVESEPGGRSGRILQFLPGPDDTASMVPAWLEFDLDLPPGSNGGPDAFSIVHERYEHIARLLAHSRVVPLPSWVGQLKRQGVLSLVRERRKVAEAMWFGLPVALAFAAMMNSHDGVETRASDHERLNAARMRRGLPTLPDHLEVTLKLGGRAAENEGEAGAASRSAPRLHYVRGHYVRRSDKTFWRSPHLRGDHNTGLVQRTVRVTTGRRSSRDTRRGRL